MGEQFTGSEINRYLPRHAFHAPGESWGQNGVPKKSHKITLLRKTFHLLSLIGELTCQPRALHELLATGGS